MNDKSIKYYTYVLLLKELEGDINDIIAGNNFLIQLKLKIQENKKKNIYKNL